MMGQNKCTGKVPSIRKADNQTIRFPNKKKLHNAKPHVDELIIEHMFVPFT
jgi:hypothetical protein